MPKHRVLSLKPHLRFDRCGQDGQDETEKPDHSTSLGDSITSSTRMRFSVHTVANLFVTWRHDPHCDHEATAVLAKKVRRRHPKIRLWAYPVWGWHLPP